MTPTTDNITGRLLAIKLQIDALAGADQAQFLPVIERLELVTAELHRAVRRAREGGMPGGSGYPEHEQWWSDRVNAAEQQAKGASAEVAIAQESLTLYPDSAYTALWFCIRACRECASLLLLAGHPVEGGET